MDDFPLKTGVAINLIVLIDPPASDIAATRSKRTTVVLMMQPGFRTRMAWGRGDKKLRIARGNFFLSGNLRRS